MPKLTSCCITATAFLALTLSAHAWPDTAAARATGLHSGSGIGPVILIADEKKDSGENKDAVEGQKAVEDKKDGDEKKASDNKKKSRREHTVSKREIMRRVRQHLPSEYQEYVR